MTFVEESIVIFAEDIKQLCSRTILVVKVQYRHQPVEEATWEIEYDMQEQYPNLFKPSGIPLSLFSRMKVILVVDIVMIL